MKCAIGQDSHVFYENKEKVLKLGGITINNHKPLKGNSDADVILHALTNAISGITGINILGSIADKMCLEKGITDSSEYVKEALKYLNNTISHVSFSVECKTPHMSKHIPSIRENIASLLDIDISCVGLTATSGEGLTAFGKGLGISCLCIISVI